MIQFSLAERSDWPSRRSATSALILAAALISACSEAPTYTAEEIAGTYRLTHYLEQPLPYVIHGEPNDSILIVGGDLLLAANGGANAGDSMHVVSVDSLGAVHVRDYRGGAPGSFTIRGASIDLYVQLQPGIIVRRAGTIMGSTITLTQYPVIPDQPELNQRWRYVRE